MKLLLTLLTSFLFFILGMGTIVGAMKLCMLVTLCGLLKLFVQLTIIFVAICFIVLLWMAFSKLGEILEL